MQSQAQKTDLLASACNLWQSVHMVRDRHKTYSDRQAEAARQKKVQETLKKQEPKTEPETGEGASQNPPEPVEKP